MNPSQLLEHELNFIGQNIRYRMEELKTTQDKFNLAIKFVSMVDEETATMYKNVWDDLSDEEKEQFVQELITDGIYLQERPFWNNSNIFTLEKLYNEFDIDKYNTNMTKIPLIVAEEYYLRLTCSLLYIAIYNDKTTINCWKLLRAN